jgi:hypothetical protein
MRIISKVNKYISGIAAVAVLITGVTVANQQVAHAYSGAIVKNTSTVGLKLEVYSTTQGYIFLAPGASTGYTVTRFYLGTGQCASWHLANAGTVNLGPGWAYPIAGTYNFVNIHWC